MPDLNWNKLVQDMLGAAKPILEKHYKEAEPYAQAEFKKIGEAVTLIIELKAVGKIDEKRAALHLKMQSISAKNVLLAIEGIGLVAAEEAINAALGVIKKTVNGAVGWTIIP